MLIPNTIATIEGDHAATAGGTIPLLPREVTNFVTV
jgi:hypothetical protein